MEIGNNLKKLRNSKGMTQKDLADSLNVSYQAVSRWENNEVEPDISTLSKLSSIFGVPVDAIINGDIEKKEEPKEEPEQTIAVIETIIERAPSTSNNSVQAQQIKAPLHVCEVCKKDIQPADLDIEQVCVRHARRGHSAQYRTAYYHKSCLANKKIKEKQLEEAARKYHASSAAKKCWGWSIAVGVVALTISLIIGLCNPSTFSTGGSIGVSLLIGVGLFAMMYCILSGSYIGEVFVWCAGLSIKFPGIIFSFDLGGFAFLIVMKILFAILGFLIGVAALLFAICLSAALGIVSFPFVLIHNIHTDYEDAF